MTKKQQVNMYVKCKIAYQKRCASGDDRQSKYCLLSHCTPFSLWSSVWKSDDGRSNFQDFCCTIIASYFLKDTYNKVICKV